jgi:hypothetical protein
MLNWEINQNESRSVALLAEHIMREFLLKTRETIYELSKCVQ